MQMSNNTTQEVGRSSSALIGCLSHTLPAALVPDNSVLHLFICLHLCVSVTGTPAAKQSQDVTWTSQMSVTQWLKHIKSSQMDEFFLI